jgi:hypothetical protein
MNYKAKIALCFITASILISVATSASAQTVAFFTGNQRMTNSGLIACEYQYGLDYFWSIQRSGLCPLTITLR